MRPLVPNFPTTEVFERLTRRTGSNCKYRRIVSSTSTCQCGCPMSASNSGLRLETHSLRIICGLRSSPWRPAYTVKAALTNLNLCSLPVRCHCSRKPTQANISSERAHSLTTLCLGPMLRSITSLARPPKNMKASGSEISSKHATCPALSSRIWLILVARFEHRPESALADSCGSAGSLPGKLRYPIELGDCTIHIHRRNVFASLLLCGHL